MVGANQVGAARAVGIITLVVTAVLGSAFLLGRGLVPDASRTDAAVTATGAEHPEYADQSALDADPEHTRAPHAEPDRSQSADPQEQDPTIGPMGTRVSTGTAGVALTFDDGPHPDYTPQVLAILRDHHVTATFCVVGKNAQAYPWLVEQIVAEGHTLCNHSWDHDVALGARSADWIRADLMRTSEAIRAAVPDAPIAWYRQPGGAWTYSVVSVSRDLGMAPLHWTLDPSDWRAPGASRIAASVINEARPGSIVLLHDAGGDRQGTVNALYRILPELAGRFEVQALPPRGL
ncbi:polysaccharide deacetylase family protein [Verrucosispora sioxanthis]|uniref:Polysaccharide deacetylase family protein n=1 Tax=Verrucosispora sioxanthis TaxID=2499994 RepID=A0A6M1L8S7_9ACTN|nr:polysaccharide deacetylase family protein [Verrucosispora sioxanthis]NEE65532.1 polysaccharide deacetylase family protein [Verrucosispora sioxanthis]NGM14642.1 polysaccharide deacetylase family protein [Verrucosispora sioxanthis]